MCRCKHENLKTIQAHEVRVSTLQQQVVDGEAMNVQLNKLVESAHAQKNSQEVCVCVFVCVCVCVCVHIIHTHTHTHTHRTI
jgi:hypothetical protein